MKTDNFKYIIRNSFQNVFDYFIQKMIYLRNVTFFKITSTNGY